MLDTGFAKLRKGIAVRHSLVVDFSQVYGAQLVGQALAFVKSFLIARYLQPEGLGLWKSLELLVQYHQFTTLGTQNGMSREVSFWIGRRDTARSSAVERTAFGQVFTLPLLGALLIAGASFWPGVDDSSAWALRAVATVAMLTMVAVLVTRIYTARLLFGYTSLLQVVGSVVSLGAVAVLVPLWQFNGFLVSLIVTNVAILAVGWRGLGGIAFRYDWREAWRLIKIGFPIMLVGLIFLLLTTVDRMLILRYLTVTDLGYYGIALMLSQLIYQIVDSIGNVLYPRVNELFGMTGQNSALQHLAVQPALVVALSMPVLIAAAILLLRSAINWALPAYLPGVLPAQILIVGFAYAEINVLNTINRQKVYAAIQLAALALNVVVAVALLDRGYGLLAVAAGTTLSFIVYKTLTSFISLRAMSVGAGETVRFLWRLAWPYAYIIGISAVGESAIARFLDDQFARVALESVLLIVVSIPLVYIMWRRYRGTLLQLARK